MELDETMGRKIRGMRVCQNEECRLPHSRDRTAASHIGFPVPITGVYFTFATASLS